MSRVSKSEVLHVGDVINYQLIRNGYTHRVWIEWAYGRPRVYLHDENGCQVRELSPRLSTGPMLDWLRAYLEGLEMGLLRKA